MAVLLSDQSMYLKLERHPMERFKHELKSVVESGYKSRILTKKEMRYLNPSAWHSPTIFTLPKIHKNLQFSPGRPNVNRIGLVSARLDEYLAKFFQPSILVPILKTPRICYSYST